MCIHRCLHPMCVHRRYYICHDDITGFTFVIECSHRDRQNEFRTSCISIHGVYYIYYIIFQSILLSPVNKYPLRKSPSWLILVKEYTWTLWTFSDFQVFTRDRPIDSLVLSWNPWSSGYSQIRYLVILYHIQVKSKRR